METFNAGHHAMLERVATGAPLPQLLEDIVRFIERQSAGMMCSILLLDSEERCVRHGAAPSLPTDFVHALDGSRIGPEAGSCGAAAYLGETVIVSDIATHPNWAPYRHLALPHGLRACWSMPIFSPEKEVLGTFAMYYREIRSPTDEEHHWVEIATHLASIAILRDRAEQQLHQSEQRARQLARLYAVSNSINETIVRVRDPQELYNFACQIAVEQGLARQAWVGLCVKADQAVLPKARCGPNSEMLDSLELSLVDERISQGPTVRAIRTGEPALSNDIVNDRNFSMQALAEQCGVKSCAVFPLKIGGRAIGVFALGADQPNYFRSEEIQVLSTLAADISLAVESIVNERERRRMEAAIRESEAMCAFIYSSVEDAIVYLSIEGPDRYRFLSANPSFLKSTGLSENEVIGKLLNEVIPKPSLALVLQKFEQAISRREKVYWDETSAYPTGLKHGHVTLCPIFDAEGRCSHLIETIHDITELKQEQNKRLALESQLHRSLRLQSLGTLAGGIAHDFNNILSSLSIRVETALQKAAPRPVRGHFLEIQKTIDRAAGLVRQILTFGRREPPHRAMANLRNVVDEALASLRTTLPSHVHIVTRFASRLPDIAVDAAQIHQAVLNLCQNAADALGASGGKIEVRLDGCEQNAELTAAPAELPEGPYIRLSVTDNGCGMDEATVKRVFDPFFTTKPPDKGTGLGLSVVDGIVKGHNGAIDVESELGRGTTFRLYFPVTTVETAKKSQARTVYGGDSRVLYVDDEEALTLLVPRALSRIGYRVTAYSDPLAALRDFRSHPDAFDLIVTDIAMPDLSGPELAKEIRHLRPDIPIVMLTGYIGPEDREMMERLHVNKLLYKPTSVADLSQTLSQELGSIHPYPPAASPSTRKISLPKKTSPR
jgi:PAS domain S-box-containing protein